MDSVSLLLNSLLFVAVGIPTLIFYGWILFFAVRAIICARRAKWQRVKLFACLALAPCAVYAALYFYVYADHQLRAATIVGAQSLPKPPIQPRTLVIHGPHSSSEEWQNRLVEMGAFDEVYVTWRQATIRLANARDPSCKNESEFQNPVRARTGFLVCATATKVDRVPDNGLHLYMTGQNRTPPRSLESEPISLELRMIEGDRQDIIGRWAVLKAEYPVFPPVLTLIGFQSIMSMEQPSVANYGALALIFKWLGIQSKDLTPQNLPAPNEIRAEFLQHWNSTDRKDRRTAGFIASAVGAAALKQEDVEPLIMSNVVDSDFGREIGFQQFCPHINRLCDFRDRLTAACKAKRLPQYQQQCDRIPQQCDWCEKTPLCRPESTGDETGCTKEAADARAKSLERLRPD